MKERTEMGIFCALNEGREASGTDYAFTILDLGTVFCIS